MPISYLYTGEPMNGTANDDFVIAYKGSTGTDNNTVDGNAGDDLVIADSSDTWIPNASYLNGSIADAFNLETLTGTWTTAENQMFGNSTIPHTTVIAEATIGQSEFYRVQIGAGQQITIDIDFASNTALGSPRDLLIELQDSLGNVIVTADDSLVTDGGLGSNPSSPGSASSHDPYLVYTVANAGIYYINVRPFGGGPGSTFAENNTFVMNVSVTGHATAASNPVQGTDTVNGGDGDDTILGQGGNDILNGGFGNDRIDGGSGGDVIHGNEGDDTLSGGDASEENVHGDEGNDTLISGGEGHYYGDAGDDLILAGITSGINEVLDGGSGIDTIDTRTWNGTYTISLVNGATNFGESFINFENVITGNGADTITGTTGDNVITTNAGVDVVFADEGDDIVAGGADGDALDGGGGRDTLSYRASSGAVTIDLATNSASGGHATGDVISNFESVWGSVLGDALTGNGGNNVLRGYEGNDVLDGGAGSDVLDGGINDDTMTGGLGDDTYYVDSLGDAIIEAEGEGTDAVLVSFTYSIAALLGIDRLSAMDANAVTAIDLTGNALDNRVTGNDGINTLLSAGGNDELFGNGGDDVLNGGAGDDVVEGGAGGDGLNGGADTDILSYRGSALAVVVNLAAGTASGGDAAGDNFSNFEGVWGSAKGDTLTANAGNNELRGFGGSDTLSSGTGNDTLDGGTGADVMTGGIGNDTYCVDNAGDTVNEAMGEGTADTIAAGYSYSIAAFLAIERLATIDADATTAINLTGNTLDNRLTGNEGTNRLSGGLGADTIDAGGGADRLIGGDGADDLDGEGGNDVLSGGLGNDTMRGGDGDDLYYVDAAGDTVIEGVGAGADIVRAGIDYVLTNNVEELFIGGAARDGTGNGLDNILHGSGSNNTLLGLGGDDTIRGGGGRDTITGGDGEDLIDGGVGKDTLTGGVSRDVFQFRDGDFGGTRALADLITDFSHADAEKIHLSLVDADTTLAGNQSFAWIGSGAFTGVAGQLHYAQQAGTTYVEGDTNGDGTADFVIALTGTVDLVASDFVL